MFPGTFLTEPCMDPVLIYTRFYKWARFYSRSQFPAIFAYKLNNAIHYYSWLRKRPTILTVLPEGNWQGLPVLLAEDTPA
jgi:hypothetical protein